MLELSHRTGLGVGQVVIVLFYLVATSRQDPNRGRVRWRKCAGEIASGPQLGCAETEAIKLSIQNGVQPLLSVLHP